MKRGRLVLLLPVLALLAGCSSGQIAVTAEPLCAAVAHVCVSKADQLTEGTAVQIEANNLGRAKVCPRPKGEDPCGSMRQKPEPAKKKPAAKVATTS